MRTQVRASSQTKGLERARLGLGVTLKIRLTSPKGEERLARFARVGLLRHALAILRKKETRMFCSLSIKLFMTGYEGNS